MNREVEWLLREKYHGEKSEGFFTDCARLEADEPLDYVIGWVPFLNTKIWLDSHPLIPRTETEYWVEKVIAEIKIKLALRNTKCSAENTLKILDLCAGSGAIGVAVAKALPQARVDFCEIDARLHTTIEKNILKNGIDPSRTHIFGGNLFEYSTDTYDIILTNPPYINPAKIEQTQNSVLKYEPHLALFGGKNGMDSINRIIRDAPRRLKIGGLLYIEHEPEQAEDIQKIAIDTGYATCTPHTDQFDVIRWSKLSVI